MTSKATEVALKIMELLEGEGNADVDDVRAVQQIIEMEMDAIKMEALSGVVDSRRQIIADLRARTGVALFSGKGAVEMTQGEFVLAWQEQLIAGHVTPKGTMFTFLGVPVARKGLDG